MPGMQLYTRSRRHSLRLQVADQRDAGAPGDRECCVTGGRAAGQQPAQPPDARRDLTGEDFHAVARLAPGQRRLCQVHGRGALIGDMVILRKAYATIPARPTP